MESEAQQPFFAARLNARRKVACERRLCDVRLVLEPIDATDLFNHHDAVRAVGDEGEVDRPIKLRQFGKRRLKREFGLRVCERAERHQKRNRPKAAHASVSGSHAAIVGRDRPLAYSNGSQPVSAVIRELSASEPPGGMGFRMGTSAKNSLMISADGTPSMLPFEVGM